MSGGGQTAYVRKILTANAAEAGGCVAAMTDQLTGAVPTLVNLVARRAVRQVDHRLTTTTATPASAPASSPGRN